MKAVIWIRNLSRRVIRLFSNTSHNLIHYSKVVLGSGVGVMSEHEKPVWIKREGVDVAVVISPELFEELVSAQEELEDIAAVDEAMKNTSPGIPWDQVQETLAKDKYVFGPDIDLDKEVVLDKRGRRITEVRAQQIARQIIRENTAGRPLLTGAKIVSPKVKARVPKDMKDKLDREAKKFGVTPSVLIRQALEEYLYE